MASIVLCLNCPAELFGRERERDDRTRFSHMPKISIHNFFSLDPAFTIQAAVGLLFCLQCRPAIFGRERYARARYYLKTVFCFSIVALNLIYKIEKKNVC